MAEYVTLLGAEEVQSAARQMQSAADDMRHAASSFDDTARQLRSFMDEWVVRLEQVLRDSKS